MVLCLRVVHGEASFGQHANKHVPNVFCPCPHGNALPELLGKRNDDALGAADVTEPVHVLILGYFAYELSAMSAQAREDILNVVDGEHDATYAQRVHRCVLRLSSDRRRRVELAAQVRARLLERAA